MSSLKIKSKIRNKPPTIQEYCKAKIEAGYSMPSEIKASYEMDFPKAKIRTLSNYCKACKKVGFNKEARDKIAVDVERKEIGKHIFDYDEIKKYEFQASQSGVQLEQIERQKASILTVWQLNDYTDPHTWTYQSILTAIGKKYNFKKDEQTGAMAWDKRGAVRTLLSAVNTMFPTIMAKGWYTAYTRKDSLKDYFTFDEVDLFLQNVTDTEMLSLEGWKALFIAQINMGCREGARSMQNTAGETETRNGILSLRWDNIDYTARRAKLHEKGGKGKSSRVWEHLPLDLFPWLNGWHCLMLYHIKTFGYEPTNDRHESGPCFKVLYGSYLRQFTETRKRCNGRIAGTKETLRPHILRKTHAQWLVKLYVPIEQICGIFPDGYFGVGWDNPQVLMKYYITIESEQREKAEKQARERMIKLGVVQGEIEMDPKDKLIHDLTQRIKELTDALVKRNDSGTAQQVPAPQQVA
jgi:integrase